MLLISSSVPEGAINKGFENIKGKPDYISGSLIEIWSVLAYVKIMKTIKKSCCVDSAS